MRDVSNHRYDGDNFAGEKVIATLHLIMFVLIVGMGVYTQLLSVAPDPASSAAIAAMLR